MLRKVLLILSGNAAASLLLFTRNLLVARLISVEDYGIAATFAIAMAVVEMTSQLGLQQLIVQARDGDDPKFQAALQGFQVLRGVMAGCILVLAAGLVADFLRIPEVAWAYQLMGLVPVLTAVQHFDIHRLSRKMRFVPMILTGAVPALLSLLAIWPLAQWMGDYRVMLYALLLQAALAAITSHLVAERPYRLSLDLAIMRQALSFGWPLLVNGLLLFAVFQGEKLIVGREMGMAVLAIFAMGVTMTLTPTLVMAKSAQNFFLPQLSRLAATRTEDPAPFVRLSHAMMQAALLNGALLVVLILMAGPWVVSSVLGAKYADLIPLLVIFAVQQGLRVFKSGPNVIALSCGYAINAMISNMVRVASLPLAWWAVVTQEAGITTLLYIAIVAEALGFAAALGQMIWRLSLPVRPSVPAFMLAALLLAAACLTTVALPAPLTTAAFWACPLLLAALFVAMPELRGHILSRE
jgi:O-antigen/teichoic acid export membrane protein